MVDTTDSKSVASNRVRVQVSSPVLNQDFQNRKSFFYLISFFIKFLVQDCCIVF